MAENRTRSSLALLILAVGLLLEAGCASEAPPPVLDPIGQQLDAVVALHGWPCGGVTSYRTLEAHRYQAACRDGQNYEVYLREDWNWRAADRQTGLHQMLDIGEQTELLKTAADPAERRKAAGSLGQLGASAYPAVPALIEALADADAGVRRSAAEALGRIGPQADAAIPALTAALADPDPGVREDAARALAALGKT
jgi:HEAT repeats